MEVEVPDFSRGRIRGQGTACRNRTGVKRVIAPRPPSDQLPLGPGLSGGPLSYGNEGGRGGSVPARSLRFSRSLFFPLPAALPLRSPSRSPGVDSAPGRGERFSAEQTKPAAAMGGGTGLRALRGPRRVPGWAWDPLAKNGIPSSLSSRLSPFYPPRPPYPEDLRGAGWEVS